MIRNVHFPRVAQKESKLPAPAYQKFAYMWPTSVVVSRARAAGVKLSVSRPSRATYKKRAWKNLSGPPWNLTPCGGRAAAAYPETCPRWTSVNIKAGHSSIRTLDPSLEGYMRCERLSLKNSHFASEIVSR